MVLRVVDGEGDLRALAVVVIARFAAVVDMDYAFLGCERMRKAGEGGIIRRRDF